MLDLRLDGKIALVTGSTAGIGLAIAAGLAAQGATVIINGRTQRRVDDAMAQVTANQSDARLAGVAADLGSVEGADRIVARHPKVDVLVNNVGIFESKAFEEIADSDWLRFFEVNVMSGIRLTRAYLPGIPACARRIGAASFSSPANQACTFPPRWCTTA
jgi:NAD(P)-dependent dehydrogenase (short-subunit alcohol dehydrogenase family)